MFTALLILASVTFILLFILVLGIIFMLPNITLMFCILLERTSVLPLINERHKRIEQYLEALSSEVMPGSGNDKEMTHMIFTPDGKYSAPTINELIKKILSDPNSGFNEENIDELKKFFKNLENDTSPDEDDDEGEEEV